MARFSFWCGHAAPYSAHEPSCDAAISSLLEDARGARAAGGGSTFRRRFSNSRSSRSRRCEPPDQPVRTARRSPLSPRPRPSAQTPPSFSTARRKAGPLAGHDDRQETCPFSTGTTALVIATGVSRSRASTASSTFLSTATVDLELQVELPCRLVIKGAQETDQQQDSLMAHAHSGEPHWANILRRRALATLGSNLAIAHVAGAVDEVALRRLVGLRRRTLGSSVLAARVARGRRTGLVSHAGPTSSNAARAGPGRRHRSPATRSRR